MRKFTTAECVEAITAKAPAVIPNLVRDFKPVWKRLSKTGKQGGPITRVFGAKNAPFINAIITEAAGTLDVRFAALPIWKVDNDGVDWDESVYDRPDVRSLLSISGRDFLYEIIEEAAENDNEVCVNLYVKDTDPACPYDQHLGATIGTILPKCANGREPKEVAECTYCIIGKPLATVHSELQAAGFEAWTLERWNEIRGKKPITKGPKPGDFVYALGFENEELCGVAHVWIAITPVAYWKKEGYAYDQHLNIASILPRNADGTEAGEEMEATFSIFGKTLEQVETEMKALGFVDDPAYKAFITRN